MINTGKLRHYLVFQTKTEASDGVGSGGTITWVDSVSVWAEKWSVKGSERVEAARSKQNSIHRWHLRFHAGIKPDMRIKWAHHGDTHYQEVLAVNDLGNDFREIEVLAEEKV
jgi:SPP1 family predicted phage head-tail adaptor